MAIRRPVLLVADIGGYTHYMHWNRRHLAHAQQPVAGLLEAVIEAGKGLKLAKLAGPKLKSGVLLAAGGNAKVLVCERLSWMRQSFLAQRAVQKGHRLRMRELCAVGQALLKFVVPEGEVAEQRVKRRLELAGVDVILVHRMPKNTVPVVEYVLMTDPVAACLDEPMRPLCKALMHDFDGIGETLVRTTKYELSSLPFRPGFKNPPRDFVTWTAAPRKFPPS